MESDLVNIDSRVEPRIKSYKHKLLLLKNISKNQIFLNAALCDHVAETQSKLVIAKEKRRFLTEKLYQIRAQLEVDNQLQTSKTTQQLIVSPQQLFTSSFEEENVRRVNVNFPQFNTEDDSLKPTKKKAKVKKAAGIAGPSKVKKVVEPTANQTDVESDESIRHMLTQVVPVNGGGMPVYPLVVDGLTIHSIGQLQYEDNHREPIGYCTSRVYASMRDVSSKCVYTCKILPGGSSPSFVIEYEDYEDVGIPLRGSSASECVGMLMQSVNKAIGFQIVQTRNMGEKFFGLSHPGVKDLMKTLRLPKKNLDKNGITISIFPDEKLDDSINFDALQNKLAYYNFDFEDMDVAEEVLGSFE